MDAAKASDSAEGGGSATIKTTCSTARCQRRVVESTREEELANLVANGLRQVGGAVPSGRGPGRAGGRVCGCRGPAEAPSSGLVAVVRAGWGRKRARKQKSKREDAG